MTAEQWRQTFYDGLPGTQDTKRRTFHRVSTDLLAKRVVVSMHDFVWFARAADE